MKRFYALFGVIAAAGVGFLFWQMNKSSTPAVPVQVTVQPGDTAGFRGYVLGSDSAPVEIIEYADYQCPACQQFATVEWPYVRERLVQTGRVRWVFRDFPLQQHPWARLAAHAAACSNEQGKFWEYTDAVFATQPDWSASRDAGKIFRDQVTRVGLDAGAWDACMSSLKFAGRIQGSADEGLRSGVGSTPSFVIGGKIYAGVLPYDRIKALVDSLSPAPNP
jgi:protein-disulfide isomerase